MLCMQKYKPLSISISVKYFHDQVGSSLNFNIQTKYFMAPDFKLWLFAAFSYNIVNLIWVQDCRSHWTSEKWLN